MPLEMASAIANGTTAHKHRTQSSGIGTSTSMNRNERGSAAQPGSIGQGFGGGKASWNSNIWGSSGFPSHFRDSATEKGNSQGHMANGGHHETSLEGKTGSGSLLATSESEGWAGRTTLPWNLERERLHHAPGQRQVNGRESMNETDASVPGFSRQDPGLRESSPSQKRLVRTSASPPSAALNGFAVNDNRWLLNNSTLVNGTGKTVSAATGNVRLPERSSTQPSLNFPHFQPAGSSTLNSKHLSHIYVSTLPDQHVHSAQSSFYPQHTHTDHQNRALSQQDLAQDLSRLQLRDEDGFNVYQQTATVPGSQRPQFIAGASHDGVSFDRFRSQEQAEEGNFALYHSEASFPESGHGYVQSPVDTVKPGSFAPGDYSHYVNSAVYAPSGTPRSGNRLVRLPMSPAEILDRKLLQEQHELFRGSPNLPTGFAFNSNFNLIPYGPPGMSPLANLYALAPFGGIPPSVPRTPYRDQDTSQSLRSPLLEEFRASKGNKRYELKDIYNHIVEFSGDQHGSRFIQQKLETANSDEKEQVFQEIKPNAIQLMMDVFGNYVIQKLFEHGNQAQKKSLAQQMMGHILTLSTQMYGCRVVQKALEHVLTDQQADMVKELEHQVMRCVKDQNGNHVIQKAIERVPTVHIRFIVNDFKGQISRLAAHPYGCRVIQRMLEHCEESDKQSILAELHACTASLIPDQFGNYVIQHVIQNGDERDRSRIISIVMLQLLSFSKHKFASNVVEKSVEYGSAVQRSEILNLLITPNERGESPLFGLMRDQYGNYVIQKVLEQSKGTHRGALIRQIDPLLGQLKKMSYGKQIAAIERLIYHSPGGEAISPAFTAAKTGPGGSPAPLSTDSEGASSSDETNVTPTSPAIDTPSSRSSSLPSTNTSIIECPTE